MMNNVYVVEIPSCACDKKAYHRSTEWRQVMAMTKYTLTVRCFAQMVDEVDKDAKLITAQKAILRWSYTLYVLYPSAELSDRGAWTALKTTRRERPVRNQQLNLSQDPSVSESVAMQLKYWDVCNCDVSLLKLIWTDSAYTNPFSSPKGASKIRKTVEKKGQEALMTLSRFSKPKKCKATVSRRVIATDGRT